MPLAIRARPVTVTKPSRRSRKSAPKTKTGCRTCKIRRVKCGEEKPQCLRCIKFGTQCDGYASSPAQHPFVIETVPQTGVCIPRLPPKRVSLPFFKFFHNNDEYNYFLLYQEESASEISGTFDAKFWNYVVLQACQSEPSLCRLTSAIGALHRASKSRTRNDSEEEIKSYTNFALKEYGRALQGIQRMISDSQQRDTTILALIASLLIYCFENMNGDVLTAITHMRSALHLMKQQLSKTNRQYRHLQDSSSMTHLDDDMIKAFVRLESSIISRPDGFCAQITGSGVGAIGLLNINSRTEIHNLPLTFDSLNQARCFYEDMIFRMTPKFFALMLATQNNDKPDKLWDTTNDMAEGPLVEMDMWYSAFAPLYADTLASGSKKERYAATMVQLSYVSIRATLMRSTANNNNSSDGGNQGYREALIMSRAIMDDPSYRKTFVFDTLGPLAALFSVVGTCKDMDLRQEALALLKESVPRREAAWDSATLVVMAEQILQTDASGESCGWDVRLERIKYNRQVSQLNLSQESFLQV